MVFQASLCSGAWMLSSEAAGGEKLLPGRPQIRAISGVRATHDLKYYSAYSRKMQGQKRKKRQKNPNNEQFDNLNYTIYRCFLRKRKEKMPEFHFFRSGSA